MIVFGEYLNTIFYHALSDANEARMKHNRAANTVSSVQWQKKRNKSTRETQEIPDQITMTLIHTENFKLWSQQGKFNCSGAKVGKSSKSMETRKYNV